MRNSHLPVKLTPILSVSLTVQFICKFISTIQVIILFLLLLYIILNAVSRNFLRQFANK